MNPTAAGLQNLPACGTIEAVNCESEVKSAKCTTSAEYPYSAVHHPPALTRFHFHKWWFIIYCAYLSQNNFLTVIHSMLLDIIFIQLYISPTRTQSLLNQIEFCGAFYLYVLYSLQRGIFHYLLKLFDCHIGFFCSALWLQISL